MNSSPFDSSQSIELFDSLSAEPTPYYLLGRGSLDPQSEFPLNLRFPELQRFSSDFLRLEPIRRQLRDQEMVHEESLNPDDFDAFLPSEINPTVKFADPREPVITLEIIRSHASLFGVTTKFLITPRGMVGSLRSKPDGDITIGRQQINDAGNRPNDIMLNAQDSAISRTHCRIIYKHGLFVKRVIPPEFLTFLMASHKRLGRVSSARVLPRHLIRLIYDFIKLPKMIFIEDLGSINGTYIRVRANWRETSQGDFYLCGPRMGFVIENTFPTVTEFIKKALLAKGKWEPEIDLKNFKLQLQDALSNPLIGRTVMHSLEIFDVSKISESPCMKIKIVQGDPCGIMEPIEEHLLVHSEEIEGLKEFYLGFHPLCHIAVDLTCCRSCAAFKWDPKLRTWCVKDVTIQVTNTDMMTWKSVIYEDYGLWLSVSKEKGEDQRFKPMKRVINSGDQLKVSATVLKVSW